MHRRTSQSEAGSCSHRLLLIPTQVITRTRSIKQYGVRMPASMIGNVISCVIRSIVMEKHTDKFDVGVWQGADTGVMSCATAFFDPSIEVVTHRCCDQKKRNVKARGIPALVYVDIEMAVLIEHDFGVLRPEQTTRVDPRGNPEMVCLWYVTGSAAQCYPRANSVAVAG